jgi:tetratricopeptide (TPR) repeat protein
MVTGFEGINTARGDARSVCLCMIVKNEAETITRCLDSCRGQIDCWVVCDTGSTDGTPELIREILADIPGELHEHEWIDFAHNRSRLLALARGKADYLLLMDADWTVHAPDGAFDGLHADAYMIVHAGASQFANKRLVRGDLEWRYVGATHEYVTCEAERTCERLQGVSIQVHSVGGARTGRWGRDLKVLQAALERDPENARTVFYLAQTLRDLGHEREDESLLARGRDAYFRRAAMNGWPEERYCAWHQAGLLADELGDWPVAADAYTAAWDVRPARLEAVYDLAVGLRLRERYQAAHRYTQLAAGPTSLAVPDDDLFVAPWVYRWGLLFEYSITCFWVGRYDHSVKACDRLLRIRELPDEHRAQTRRNRRYAMEAQAERLGVSVIRTQMRIPVRS